MPKKSHLEATFLYQCKAVGLPEPAEEHRFHPTRKWRFDFAWIEPQIAVEIEGGVYSKGRHTRGKGFEGDCEKYNEATRLGWKVFRFTGGQVASGEAVNYMEKVLA